MLASGIGRSAFGNRSLSFQQMLTSLLYYLTLLCSSKEDKLQFFFPVHTFVAKEETGVLGLGIVKLGRDKLT